MLIIFLYNGIYGLCIQRGNFPDNNVLIGRKNTVGPDITWGGKLAGFKIAVFYRNGIVIFDFLACNLAKDDIIAL